jgi:transcriptional regulator with XRE-family HTH domain
MDSIKPIGEDSDKERRRERLNVLLDRLQAQGITQREVGVRTGVGSQYVSDLRAGRRAVTELFARRMGEEFNFDFLWLLTGAGDLRRPSALDPGEATSSRSPGVVLLPLLRCPELGDPRATASWDGSLFELTGQPAAIAARAVNPYVLRLGHGDYGGQLQLGDLLLVSQAAEAQAPLAVVRQRDILSIARLTDGGKWRSLETGKLVPGSVEPVARCVGLVWRPL